MMTHRGSQNDCASTIRQGCGKTTLVEALEALFARNGLRAASCSIDDFYLTFADQQALAQVTQEERCMTSTLLIPCMLPKPYPFAQSRARSVPRMLQLRRSRHLVDVLCMRRGASRTGAVKTCSDRC